MFEGLAGVRRNEFVINTKIKQSSWGGQGGLAVDDDDNNDNVKCGWEATNHDAVVVELGLI